MIYECQFDAKDYIHRIMEIIYTLLVALLVLHINKIKVLMNPSTGRSKWIMVGLLAKSVLTIVLHYLEFNFCADSDTELIQNQSKIVIVTYCIYYNYKLIYIMMILYLAGSSCCFSSHTNNIADIEVLDYNNWTVGDIPLELIYIATVYSFLFLWDSLITFTVWYDKNSSICFYLVPVNIIYQIHR